MGVANDNKTGHDNKTKLILYVFLIHYKKIIFKVLIYGTAQFKHDIDMCVTLESLVKFVKPLLSFT